MIEAVNSVISNAPFLRASTEQVSSVRLELPESVSAGPQAPYISPFISVDVNFDTAVLQIRNSDTGDVIRQFPSESTLEARRLAEAVTTASSSARSASESTVIQAQESGGEIGVNSPGETAAAPSVATPSTPSAQAQVAAQALSAGAQAGQTASDTTSSVSVVA